VGGLASPRSRCTPISAGDVGSRATFDESDSTKSLKPAGVSEFLIGGIPSIESLLNHVADKPVLLARLACVLLAKGQSERARELGVQAVAQAPLDAEVHAIAAEIFSHNVPRWYFHMIRDGVRHQAYEMALRRVIRPGSRVLDIGTGTGLLAMMAVRAGAAEVVTCECNPTVAAVASEIIGRNGFADRVRVVAKHSADLEIGVDLTGPADVLVWDVLSNNMIGAGALPTMEHAVRRLIRPGAPTIPARGVVRVALADDQEAHRRLMDTVEGFDLSAFNRCASPSYEIDVGSKRLVQRSDPGDLFRFDFQSGGPFPESRAAVAVSSAGGSVNGIVQWVCFEFDEKRYYENTPSVGLMSCFSAMFYPLRQPIEIAAGDDCIVYGAHDRSSLRIWAKAPEGQ
jgi:type III protein arginine methyltransferase